MIIKVCGMRDAENIRAVSQLGIDWMGFIFYERSPRCVGILQPEALPHNLKRIGVFVNSELSDVYQAIETHHLDLVQLHGAESPDYCRQMQVLGIKVIKAFPISSEQDILVTACYDGAADYFLFDTKCPGYGGSGKAFDWPLLQNYRGNTPFLLSGGINRNSLEALQIFRHPALAGIDLNSGFEVSPGLKDVAILQEFIKKYRAL